MSEFITFYKAASDYKQREKDGLEPLKPYLKEIEDIKDLNYFGSKSDIFTDKGNYLSMAKQKFDINIKNFLWKDYLTKDIQVDDERIASVTLSLSDEAKNYIKLSDTTFPSADSSDGATPVVKKGIVNVSLIVTSTTNIKTTISGTESYILITVKDIWGKTTTAKIAVPIKNKADEDLSLIHISEPTRP